MFGFDDPVLPPEIWREILARLPVKSILRYRSVCKSWYSMISCPDFISHHSITNLTDKNGNCVLLQFRGLLGGCVMSFSSHNEFCMGSCEHDEYCPDQLLGRNLVIVGSCNGLICLSKHDYISHPDIIDFSTVTFLIWNPAIRKIVELPSLNYRRYSQEVSLVGFGFDSNTSDYKVMCTSRNMATGNDDFEIFDLLYRAREIDDCKIFDLSKGVWRSISPLLPPRVVRCPDHCPDAECYVNGAVHWIVLSGYDTAIGRSILCFDMSDESFREMGMPDCAKFNKSDDGGLTEARCVAFGGLVHVMVWGFSMYGGVDVSKSLLVCAMKEYGVTESWVKMFSIDLRSAQVLPTTRFVPAKFILWEKGEVFMVHYLEEEDDDGSKQHLVLYNTGSRKCKRIFTVTGYKYIVDMCQYKESLVLM